MYVPTPVFTRTYMNYPCGIPTLVLGVGTCSVLGLDDASSNPPCLHMFSQSTARKLQQHVTKQFVQTCVWLVHTGSYRFLCYEIYVLVAQVTC